VQASGRLGRLGARKRRSKSTRNRSLRGSERKRYTQRNGGENVPSLWKQLRDDEFLDSTADRSAPEQPPVRGLGMEILNVRVARSVWLFDARDLNPRGLNPVFFSAIKDRYHFLGSPKTPEELSWTASSPKGVRFFDGAFSIEDSLLSVSVTFFNDGIIADTGSSTRHSDTFLEDILAFCGTVFWCEASL